MDSDMEDVIKLLIGEIKESFQDRYELEASKDRYCKSQISITRTQMAQMFVKELTWIPPTETSDGYYKMSSDSFDRIDNQYLRG